MAPAVDLTNTNAERDGGVFFRAPSTPARPGQALACLADQTGLLKLARPRGPLMHLQAGRGQVGPRAEALAARPRRPRPERSVTDKFTPDRPGRLVFTARFALLIPRSKVPRRYEAASARTGGATTARGRARPGKALSGASLSGAAGPSKTKTRYGSPITASRPLPSGPVPVTHSASPLRNGRLGRLQRLALRGGSPR